MSNPSKGARLYLRTASGPRKAVWIIRDDTKNVSTGFGPDDRDQAEQRLAAYIAEKHRPARSSNRHPSEIEIADVITIYATDVGQSVARPKELGHRITALLGFFGAMRLDKINGNLCRAYVKHRRSQITAKHAEAVRIAKAAGRKAPSPPKPSDSSARRELEDLRAAIKYHHAEGLCSELVSVVLPDKSLPRERWLTRDEAAHLLWTAWKGGEMREDKLGRMIRPGQGKRKHVARFILVALYSGTRATAICQAAMRPTVGRGYVDLERGVFYRRAPNTKETKKRQPSVRLHPKLLDHLRRWHAAGVSRDSIVEWKRAPISRMAKAFRTTARDAGMPDVTPHILRHTAITWAMQNGADRWEVAGMFGVTMQIIEDVYAHHSPDQGSTVHRAISRKRG